MSWKQGAKTAGSSGVGCLNDALMWTVVAPAIGVLIALAWLSGDPLWIVATALLGLLAFVLYVLASGD